VYSLLGRTWFDDRDIKEPVPPANHGIGFPLNVIIANPVLRSCFQVIRLLSFAHLLGWGLGVGVRISVSNSVEG
jgi:hypothetical protein